MPGSDDAALLALAAIRGQAGRGDDAASTEPAQPEPADVAAMMAKLNEMYELMKSGAVAAAA